MSYTLLKQKAMKIKGYPANEGGKYLLILIIVFIILRLFFHTSLISVMGNKGATWACYIISILLSFVILMVIRPSEPKVVKQCRELIDCVLRLGASYQLEYFNKGDLAISLFDINNQYLGNLFIWKLSDNRYHIRMHHERWRGIKADYECVFYYADSQEEVFNNMMKYYAE